MASPAIWIVGDWAEPIFADVIAWLHASADCCSFDSPQAAAQNLAMSREDVDPSAIIVAVSRPGRFVASDIERLHALLPLTRLVALTGPWSEGEQRSGRPWPGIIRVSWRNWRQRLPQELRFGLSSETRSPRTVTETERVENSATSIRSKSQRSGSAAIRTHSLANYRYLADAAGQLGLAVTPRSDDGATADVVIFDGWGNLAPALEQPTQRRILMLHFPRPDDQVRANLAGIHAVLAQPPLLTDLAAALDE